MRRTKMMVLLLALVAGALLPLTAATAQTGYPPGPCTALGGSRFVGHYTVGQSFTARVSPVCLWTPGSTASIVVNGAAAFTKTVDTDGSVTITVTILSTTDLSINPIRPAVCGLNTINVTAPSAGGRLITETVTFNLLCPGVPVPAARVSQSLLARTGADLGRYGAIALALVAGGWLLTVAGRRRRGVH